MRVISGFYKGRVLFSPRGNSIRPTSDRIKESIFNYIGTGIQDAKICDLFSGSGNLSIEALSRGAKNAVMVDHSQQAIDLMKRNISHIGVVEKCRIVKMDTLQYLKLAAKNGEEFNFIFADPPYLSRLNEPMMQRIVEGNLLTEGGLFVLEQSSRNAIPMAILGLMNIAEKNFGDTTVMYFRQEGT
ncbi:MAG: 16S rRNA (guanine(966)-N(2))-methyltransferase RsmD [Candidatus Zhuqueibacterota bacterium]